MIVLAEECVEIGTLTKIASSFRPLPNYDTLPNDFLCL